LQAWLANYGQPAYDALFQQFKGVVAYHDPNSPAASAYVSDGHQCDRLGSDVQSALNLPPVPDTTMNAELRSGAFNLAEAAVACSSAAANNRPETSDVARSLYEANTALAGAYNTIVAASQ
jgi:hypothetical protein